MPISGSTNPTPAQTTEGDLDGFGIVEYDYRMGVYEIANSQWDKFKAELGVPVTGNPSVAYDEEFFNWGTGIDAPANHVSWYEAAQFVNWLNTSTVHQAAYKFTGTQGQSDYTFATWDAADAWGGTNLYRHKETFYFLPDEDEWFKAAYWNGTSIQDFATQSGDTLHQGDGSSGTGWNYYDNDDNDNGCATAPCGPWNVGSGSEELNGTFDMMGNNFEWVESPFSDASYRAGSLRGPRGGDWDDNSDILHASFRSYGNPWGDIGELGFRVASVPELTGDFNGDGVLDAGDLNIFCSAPLPLPPGELSYDLNDDGLMDHEDHHIWVKESKHTWYGDANLDLEFNSSDMVQVFSGGKYEKEENATWEEGDWDCSLQFDSGDMVTAFADGGYEKGLRADAVAVPELSSVFLLSLGLVVFFSVHRRRYIGSITNERLAQGSPFLPQNEIPAICRAA